MWRLAFLFAVSLEGDGLVVVGGVEHDWRMVVVGFVGALVVLVFLWGRRWERWSSLTAADWSYVEERPLPRIAIGDCSCGAKSNAEWSVRCDGR